MFDAPTDDEEERSAYADFFSNREARTFEGSCLSRKRRNQEYPTESFLETRRRKLATLACIREASRTINRSESFEILRDLRDIGQSRALGQSPKIQKHAGDLIRLGRRTKTRTLDFSHLLRDGSQLGSIGLDCFRKG